MHASTLAGQGLGHARAAGATAARRRPLLPTHQRRPRSLSPDLLPTPLACSLPVFAGGADAARWALCLRTAAAACAPRPSSSSGSSSSSSSGSNWACAWWCAPSATFTRFWAWRAMQVRSSTRMPGLGRRRAAVASTRRTPLPPPRFRRPAALWRPIIGSAPGCRPPPPLLPSLDPACTQTRRQSRARTASWPASSTPT